MSNYEVGNETQKIVKKILASMVTKSEFEELIIGQATEKTDKVVVMSLFKKYLESTPDKE